MASIFSRLHETFLKINVGPLVYGKVENPDAFHYFKPLALRKIRSFLSETAPAFSNLPHLPKPNHIETVLWFYLSNYLLIYSPGGIRRSIHRKSDFHLIYIKSSGEVINSPQFWFLGWNFHFCCSSHWIHPRTK